MKTSIRTAVFALMALSLATAGCAADAAPVPDAPSSPTPDLLGTIQALQTQIAAVTPTPVPVVVPAATAAPASTICTGTNLANILSVSMADRTYVAAGSAFTMIWTLENVGTCTWTPDYTLVFDGGTPLNGPSSQALNATVPPGGSIAISVPLVAPSTDGTYQGWWKLSTPWGVHFGIGTNGTSDFWVLINTTPSVTYPSYPYSAPYYYTCTWGTVGNLAEFVTETIPDGTYIAPGSAFTKTWTLENIGSCTWTTSYYLVFDGGTQMGAPSSIPLPTTVLPGQEVTLYVNMVAPSSYGRYQGYWKLSTPQGYRFGLGSSGTGDFWVLISTGTVFNYFSGFFSRPPFRPGPGRRGGPPPAPTPRGYCWGPHGWYVCLR